MRTLLVVAAIIGFSASAFAQTAVPKVGGKPLRQAKPQTPMGCKLIGTVKGTKIWAEDCIGAAELRGCRTTRGRTRVAAAGRRPHRQAIGG
jgi:hypothetical protein